MLSLNHITKRFDGVIALDGVSATIRAGAVHGVLGENGAGKTTLMRVAAGLCRPDAGSVRVHDRPLAPGSPVAAARAGIGMVHQHFMLVPTLTVVENCLIGRRDQRQILSRREAARKIRQIGRHVGLDVDPSARVETLSVGQQQRVEIVRALSQAEHVLILDEPTAVLAPQETDQLFAAISLLRRDGMAIVFISHKLGEVERICDELTILRRGRRVYNGPASALTRDQIAEYMCGTGVSPVSWETGISPARHRRNADAELPPAAALPPVAVHRPVAAGGPDATGILELSRLHAHDPGSRRFIADVCLALHPGEIVGVAGVEGNGQDVLAAVIVGTLPAQAGRIVLEGRDVTRDSVRRRAARGLAHIAEDRLGQALIPAMSLAENLVLKSFRSRRFARAGFVNWRAVRAHAATQLARFDVRPGAPSVPTRQLSGGNQQKLVLARELDGEPRLIVAHNPVRGLDVAATRFVFEQLLTQRQLGAAVLLIHSDLDELLAVSDRVTVLYNGHLALTDWPACDRGAIGRLMLGGAA